MNDETQMMSHNSSSLDLGTRFHRGYLCRGGFLLVSAVNWHRSKFIQAELDLKKDLLRFILTPQVNPLSAALDSTGLVLLHLLIN